MGAGAAGSSESFVPGLIVSKMLACFTRAKLLKISAFLLSAVCAATALLESGIAPVVLKYSETRSGAVRLRGAEERLRCTAHEKSWPGPCIGPARKLPGPGPTPGAANAPEEQFLPSSPDRCFGS